MSDDDHDRTENEAGYSVARRAAIRLRLEALFRGKTPEQWRALYRNAYDWGPDLGREIIDE